MAWMPDVSLSPAPASSKPSRLSISSWFRTRAEPVSSPSSSDIESHSAARSSLVAINVALLDQHFLEQHVVNLHRTGRGKIGRASSRERVCQSVELSLGVVQ